MESFEGTVSYIASSATSERSMSNVTYTAEVTIGETSGRYTVITGGLDEDVTCLVEDMKEGRDEKPLGTNREDGGFEQRGGKTDEQRGR